MEPKDVQIGKKYSNFEGSELVEVLAIEEKDGETLVTISPKAISTVWEIRRFCMHFKEAKETEILG